MTSFNGFKFTGPKLDDYDLPRIGRVIGVGEDVIHAVLDVEAAGKSTDSKGRLKALYEPHVAYRNSKGAIRDKLVAAGLAYPKWKRGYPADSYPRIEKAMKIDETVALLATSWGFPQILGENFALAGYDSPQAMVLDMLKDEDNQLEAMITFIKNADLDDELRVIEKKLQRGQKIVPDDARPFVRGYNGPGYAKNNYHTKFAAACNKWAKIPDTKAKSVALVDIPEAKGDDDVNTTIKVKADFYDGNVHEEVKAVQTRLDELGYPEVGRLDGRWGNRTRGAILAFRADNGLPVDGVIDDKLMAALMVATPRYVAPARANATMTDLREEGAEDVKAADNTQIAGTVVGAGGLLGGAGKVLDSAEEYGGVMARIADVIQPIQTFISDNLWLLVLGGGAVIIWQSGILKRIRLTKHQTGNDVSV